jgi:hypothetical protein
LELRRPLDDPPPSPEELNENEDGSRKQRPYDATGQGGLRLVGTMVESGRSLAIFTDATGKVEFKGVGETLEIAPGTRVDQIAIAQVTISEQGRASVMRLSDLKAQ